MDWTKDRSGDKRGSKGVRVIWALVVYANSSFSFLNKEHMFETDYSTNCGIWRLLTRIIRCDAETQNNMWMFGLEC